MRPHNIFQLFHRQNKKLSFIEELKAFTYSKQKIQEMLLILTTTVTTKATKITKTNIRKFANDQERSHKKEDTSPTIDT